MTSLYPHQMFQADFLEMYRAVGLQEALDPKYKEETENGKEIFYFFGEQVLPLVLSNEWVYAAAMRFAEEFAEEYFIMIRLLDSVQVTQDRIVETRKAVVRLAIEAHNCGKAPDKLKLTKPSDFAKTINLKELPGQLKSKGKKLLSDSRDLEQLYVNVTSKAIQSMYERGFSRIFFVVKRALKIKMNKTPSPGDESLSDTHQYINWCNENLENDHILRKLFVDQRRFYKLVRNVDSHVHGPKWNPGTNEVYLQDRNEQERFHIDVFSQRYRYLMYFCEIGVRGILGTFCSKEKGEKSNRVTDQYLKIYTDNDELREQLRDYPTQ